MWWIRPQHTQDVGYVTTALLGPNTDPAHSYHAAHMHPPHHTHASHNLASLPRTKRKGRRGGVWLCPAILLSSFLPLHPFTLVTRLGLGPADMLTWCHRGRHGGQGGRGCLCCKGRCDQQPSHLGPGSRGLQGRARPSPPSLARKTH